MASKRASRIHQNCMSGYGNNLYLDCPHARRQILPSRRGLFEGLRAGTTEVALASSR